VHFIYYTDGRNCAKPPNWYVRTATDNTYKPEDTFLNDAICARQKQG
jgi:hypothetical protein